MASHATPLRATAHTDLRRGNHPAGRALSRPTPGDSAGRAVDHVAEVLPLRRTGEVVVPLHRGAPRPLVDAAPDERSTVTPTRPERPAPLRLTRRGRLVLSGLGVVTALALAAVVGTSLAAGAGDPALELAGRSSVVVHSGDTLWSIAQSVAPDSDPRAVVDALQAANGLDDARLVPGQVLVLP